MITTREISDEITWNTYISQVMPNTFLQTWEWGQVQKEIGETVRYIGFFAGAEQIGSSVVLTVNAKRGRYIFCPHGPIVSNPKQLEEVLELLVQECKRIAALDSACAIRISPLVENTPMNIEMFKKLGFKPAPLHMHTELTWMLDISPDAQSLLSQMRKTSRHAITRSQKADLEIDVTINPADVARFWTLYEATARRHRFTPFSRHFLGEQTTQFARHNRMFMIFVSHQGEDLAAGIFMHVGDTVFYHHGASIVNSSKISAAHAVQWAAIQEAKKRGAKKYNFWGIAPDNQPKHPFAGITVFKKGFGGYAVDYMHAQDLPLTFKYWFIWILEMLRKYRRGF